MDFISGEILCFDKPYRWTSFDLVRKVRNILFAELNTKKLKVGHAGTLDPLATGLLIVCTGNFTKRIDEIQTLEKEYTGTFFLGATTPSSDLETETDQTFSIEHITPDLIHQVAENFIGEQEQVAPAYSAKKINGKRAYEFARRGENVEIKSNKITIYSFQILNIQLPEVTFKITCSKGTYIRAIAKDFGKALGSGAYLSKLCRTRIGTYTLENATTIENFMNSIKK
jgi:tRNA pseudouridine55 synthase